jgi:hypothetical protein
VQKKNGAGRPPKFSEASRPITLTLPESTLRELQLVHSDRSHAIVKLAKKASRGNGTKPPLVEIVKMGANLGLIIIGKSKVLRHIPFLHLVEVAPARYLLALDSGNDFHKLEIAINDLLEDVPKQERGERALIKQLLKHIRRVRRAHRVRMAEILLVRLGTKAAALIAAAIGST